MVGAPPPSVLAAYANTGAQLVFIVASALRIAVTAAFIAAGSRVAPPPTVPVPVPVPVPVRDRLAPEAAAGAEEPAGLAAPDAGADAFEALEPVETLDTVVF